MEHISIPEISVNWSIPVLLLQCSLRMIDKDIIYCSTFFDLLRQILGYCISDNAHWMHIF